MGNNYFLKIGVLLCALLCALSLSACGIPKPPKISGGYYTPDQDLGVRQPNIVQKVQGNSFQTQFDYFGQIPTANQIEFWYFAQNADLIGIVGNDRLVARAFYDLEKMGVNCRTTTQCFFVLDNSQYSAQMYFAKGNGATKLKQSLAAKQKPSKRGKQK